MHIIRVASVTVKVMVASLYGSDAFLAVYLSNVDLGLLPDSIPKIWEEIVAYSFLCSISTYVGG